jgi:hypothetical protein
MKFENQNFDNFFYPQNHFSSKMLLKKIGKLTKIDKNKHQNNFYFWGWGSYRGPNKVILAPPNSPPDLKKLIDQVLWSISVS